MWVTSSLSQAAPTLSSCCQHNPPNHCWKRNYLRIKGSRIFRCLTRLKLLHRVYKTSYKLFVLCSQCITLLPHALNPAAQWFKIQNVILPSCHFIFLALLFLIMGLHLRSIFLPWTPPLCFSSICSFCMKFNPVVNGAGGSFLWGRKSM